MLYSNADGFHCPQFFKPSYKQAKTKKYSLPQNLMVGNSI